MTDSCPDDPQPDHEHLADLPDGIGCTEIWERLSERRKAGDECDDG